MNQSGMEISNLDELTSGKICWKEKTRHEACRPEEKKKKSAARF